MGSTSKQRMTAQKRAREQRLSERRAAKKERKAARREEAEAARTAATPLDTEESADGPHVAPSE